MKVIAIIAQKGGAGRTTLAVHLATAASKAGYATVIIDLDPHASATSWGDKRRTKDGLEIISGHTAELDGLIETARARGAYFIVLDTASYADQTASLATQAADVVLIPCRPSSLDLKAIETTLLITKAASKPSYIVLNVVPPWWSVISEDVVAVAGLAGQGAQMAPHRLGDHEAFSRSVIDGRTAQEFEPHGKAAAEIQDLYEWLCSIVNIPTRPQTHSAA
jgi:chromosome partitioning protein